MSDQISQTAGENAPGPADGSIACPPGIPEKFWDGATNAVRVDDLAKSYRELEKHLGGSVKVPDEAASAEDIARFHRAIGVPDAADGYELQLGEDGLDADQDVNNRLHAAGFTQKQAQLVYDLAREYIGPMVTQTAADFEAERQTERLEKHFGGSDAWVSVSRQIKEWGQANLPPDALQALSTTYEGCLALHKMMQTREPELVRSSTPVDSESTDELKAMMRDPRYWRDRDPAFIRQVTDGFSRLYAESSG